MIFLFLSDVIIFVEKLIGKGGSSRVYKGCLPDGKELAVKILKPSSDALRAFVSEIEIITTLNHKHIISLFGFCFENNKLILVYDFLSGGSLEEVLHGKPFTVLHQLSNCIYNYRFSPYAQYTIIYRFLFDY